MTETENQVHSADIESSSGFGRRQRGPEDEGRVADNIFTTLRCAKYEIQHDKESALHRMSADGEASQQEVVFICARVTVRSLCASPMVLSRCWVTARILALVICWPGWALPNLSRRSALKSLCTWPVMRARICPFGAAWFCTNSMNLCVDGRFPDAGQGSRCSIPYILSDVRPHVGSPHT